MKKSFAMALCLVYFLFSCQKETTPSTMLNSRNSENVVPAVTVVTFAPVDRLRSVTLGSPAILFSDSIYVTDDMASVNSLKFDLNAKDLSFGKAFLLINDHVVRATSTFEAGTLSIYPSSPLLLPIGDYKIRIITTITGPTQHFKVKIQQTDLNITNYYYNFNALIYGLPQAYYVRAISE